MALDDKYRAQRTTRADLYRGNDWDDGNHGNRESGTSSRAKAVLAGAVALVAVLAGAVFLARPAASHGSWGAGVTAQGGQPAPPTLAAQGGGSLSATSSAKSGKNGKHGKSASATHASPSVKSTAATAGPSASDKLIFSSDFSGGTLDSSVWGICYPWTSSSGCTNYGNTDEKEWYSSTQVKVSGGALELTAQHEPTAGTNKAGAATSYTCRSGLVTSHPGLNFKYGFVQFTAQIPMGAGLWPALWLAASNEQWPPEVDILEHWGTSPVAKVYLHPLSGIRQGGPAYSSPDLGVGYHTFSLSWTASRLTWYIDGNQVFTTTTGVPQQSMYVTMNLADTSTAAGTCDGTLKIKSVKVWQPAQ